MKKFMVVILGALIVTLTIGFTLAAESKEKEQVAPLYKIKALTIDKKQTSLSKYKGKVLLIVNVASKCGYTPQYEGLEKLYKKYKGKDFVILGFPCNQFGSQEPGTEKEIKTFCDSKFGVTFPLFSKIEVNGEHTHPLYQYLKKALPDDSGKGDIGWNFTKFLIGRDGLPVKRFASSVKPEEIDTDVKGALSR